MRGRHDVSAVLVADAVSPRAGVFERAAASAQDGLVAIVVPDVPAAIPIEIAAGVTAFSAMQLDALSEL